MTSPAIALAKECGFDPLGPQHEAMVERFYARAQAQALRDAAELIYDDYGCDVDSAAKLRRRAYELESKA